MNIPAWQYYFRFYRGSLRPLILSVMISIGQSVVALPLVFLVQYAIDRVIPVGNLELLILVGVGIFLLNLTNSALTLWTRYLSLKTTKLAIRALRDELLIKCYDFPRTYYASADLGALHTSIVQDTERLDIMSNAVVAVILPALCVSLGLAAVLIFLNWFLFLTLISVAPLLFIVNRVIGKRIKKWVTAFHQSFETFSKGTLFVLQMIDLTRMQTAEPFEIARQRTHLEELRITSGTMAWLQTAYASLQGALATISGILILVIGGVAIAAGSMTLGGLLAFYVTVALLNSQTQMILSSIPQIITGNKSLNTLFEIIQQDDRPPYAGRRRVPFSGGIVFESVDFKYKERLVLQDINLEIHPSTIVALQGPNGVGKTTIIYLILGFYRPDRGNLYADGYSFYNLDIAHLRQSIAVVPQSPLIFSGTILENITYGYPEAMHEQVERAAELATANEFIQKLPECYDTFVGERGMLLSAGQQQRIAIARALLRKPKLLILDEPTTHLDEQAVGGLMSNLRKLDPLPAVLLVSHDPNILQSAHQVYLMQEGRIVSSHAQMMLKQNELSAARLI
jgi:ATP-binding cassette, subfamily B, bacterial